MTPHITVVVSAFNSEAWLRECLKQLRNQTVIELCEVVVIDSGSDQDAGAVCQEFAKFFPNLLYERTARETLYAAWNRGLAKARGEYFVNVNTDDALAPDALECFVRAMEEDPDAALAYADCVWSPTPNASYPWPDSWKRVRYELYAGEMALFYCFTSCTQFWRTSALKCLGGFDPEFKAAGDYEILCRMVSQGMKAMHIPRPLSAFYQNPNGLSQMSSSANDEFLRTRALFRNEVKLSQLYGIDESNAGDVRGAHLRIAVRALKPRVPWHDAPVAEVDYAIHNLLAAATTLPSSSVRSRLLRRAAFMVSQGALGNKACEKQAKMLLSPIITRLLNGKPLPRKL
jgi:hypothetical protein